MPMPKAFVDVVVIVSVYILLLDVQRPETGMHFEENIKAASPFAISSAAFRHFLNFRASLRGASGGSSHRHLHSPPGPRPFLLEPAAAPCGILLTC
jgi:hypothetical protein